MQLPLNVVLTISAVVLISACGGGGGSAAGTPTASGAALTPANQTVVTQEAVSSAFLPLTSAQSFVGAQSTDESVLFALTRQHLSKLPTYFAEARANQSLTGAILNQSFNCSGGGTVSASATDADNNTLSAGDSVTVTALNCKELEGVINGTLSFTINSLSGTYGGVPSNLSATVSFGNFSVIAAQFSASLNGSLTMTANKTALNTAAESFSTPALTATAVYGGETRTRSLTNFNATANVIPSGTTGSATSFIVSGTLASTAIGSQSITLSTPTAFVRTGSAYYPSSGVMVITGSNNTSVRVTALSATQVKSELDANGDGTYESSSTVNWNTLM